VPRQVILHWIVAGRCVANEVPGYLRRRMLRQLRRRNGVSGRLDYYRRSRGMDPFVAATKPVRGAKK
jgi:hypothetical protein